MNKVNPTKSKAMNWIVFASIICAIYVALGAFGSHGLEGKLSDKQLATYNTGLRYMIIHGLGLLLINLSYLVLHHYNPWPNRFALAGLLLFSVSLLLHATKDMWGFSFNVFAFLAPFGGLCFILFWVIFAVTLPKK